jgi:hypothetical protein
VNEEAIKIRHLVCQLHETVNPADKSEDAEYAQISAQARSTWCTLVANYWKLQPQIISEIEHLTGQVKENVDQAIAAQIITGQDIHKIESHDQGEKK